ncbi:MAG: transglycosylase SLT domain-containing protein [Rhodospirillaceae bacterium]|nr:transglycosylase SLT domain-containing protein [Rhodospirillaceae bacterium]
MSTPAHAQSSAPSTARILPERKPAVPERAVVKSKPEKPGLEDMAATAPTGPTLPTRKPPAPARALASKPGDSTNPTSSRFGVRTESPFLSPRDKTAFEQAVRAAAAGRWSAAREAMRRVSDQTLASVVEWIAMRTPGAKVDFGERTAFIEAHPDWPSINELKRITEDVAMDSGGVDERLRWFAKHPPVTTAGRVALADAALQSGDLATAEKVSREAWLSGRFDAGEERDFLRKFSRFMTPDLHRARLEELLYAEQRTAADRMLKRVDQPRAAVAAVRMALIASAGNVERLIQKLPANLAADPGLAYDRIKWRRKRGREDSARELLPTSPDEAPRPDLWWKERNLLARDSIEKGRHREAYAIVTNHGALDAVSVSEAEWLAGWLALRFLKDNEAALKHFEKVHETVQLAANVSRGAYWAGRAAQELGRAEVAADWYRKAATHITTFYGQLALGRLTDPTLPQLPLDPTPSIEERRAFEGKALTKAVRALGDIGETPYLRSFVLALAESSDFAVDRHMAAELAHRLGRPDLGVWIARQAGRDRITIMTYGYPTPAMALPQQPEKALTLAIMRQESNFDVTATSPAGALGLMQLMPATASAVAKLSKLPYAKSRLTSDASYNATLGSIYLASLVNEFDGSYIMAAAGYNAGPGRSRQWARAFGDPRAADVDAIDWIEQIPFTETRNYVQRIMENLMVYRAVTAGTLAISQDLEKELKGPRAP